MELAGAEEMKAQLLREGAEANARLDVAQRTAATLEHEVGSLREALAAAEAAAASDARAAAASFATMEHARRQADEMAVGSTTMLGELQRTEAALEAEQALNAQLTDALQRLKTAHDEALDLPAQMEAGFDQKLRALVASHEEARRMWMAERRQDTRIQPEPWADIPSRLLALLLATAGCCRCLALVGVAAAAWLLPTPPGRSQQLSTESLHLRFGLAAVD